MSKKKNKAWLLAGTLAGVGLLFGLRRGVVTVGATSASSLEDALAKAANEYGMNYARRVEQLMRWETAHFTSQQWKEGNTSGMEATSTAWPYGWASLAEWAAFNRYDPLEFSTYTMRENNTGITKRFIRFPSAGAFVDFVAWFIYNKRGGHFGKWYSLNEQAANNYLASISEVKPRIVDSL